MLPKISIIIAARNEERHLEKTINSMLNNTEYSNYEIIIYWSEDVGAFVAEVPELPGCMADGKTYQEAVANVEVIIKEWIQTAKELGRPIPQPRGRLMFA